MKNIHKINNNIYITSDEQAKEGNWGYIPFQGGNVKLVGKYFADDWKKIILTTDQDLIKDGVQAIDDEFLEWFVKNPSCEYVEYVGDDCYREIIIPQEETKQETLEEVAERLYGKLETGIGAERRLVFIAGAKWQQDMADNWLTMKEGEGWDKIMAESGSWDDSEILAYIIKNYNPPTKKQDNE